MFLGGLSLHRGLRIAAYFPNPGIRIAAFDSRKPAKVGSYFRGVDLGVQRGATIAGVSCI